MNTETIKAELKTLTDGELDAVRSIVEFNVLGILVGDRQEAIEKLRLILQEVKNRQK